MAAQGQNPEAAKRAWEASVRAWSKDDCSDAMRLMKLGEAMMFAATDYICALERLRDKGRTLSDALNAYGYPVSAAHWEGASGGMSVQARALHLAADGFRQALSKEPS